VCSECGSIHKSVTFATFERNGRKISELKCPNAKCAELIENAGMTLRYYCGYVVPDSSAIQRSIISNDLAASKFFQDFTVILGPVVRKECDGVRRGKREFEELRGYASMGRIRLESVGNVESLPDDISGTVRENITSLEGVKSASIDMICRSKRLTTRERWQEHQRKYSVGRFTGTPIKDGYEYDWTFIEECEVHGALPDEL